MTDKEKLEEALIEAMGTSNNKNNKKRLVEETDEIQEYLSVIKKDDFKNILLKVIESGVNSLLDMIS